MVSASGPLGLLTPWTLVCVSASVAAFYADCRHEVKPVRTGYRVTFTCNLLLDSDPAGEVPAEPSAEAARYLTEHFTTRVSRWKGDDREPPNRLVYLLDHEYTQRGLGWDRLKGADAERAAFLRAAAEDAGCEAVLALTEIKETWDTEPGRRGRGVDLTYIITSELTLSWWTGVPGGEPISLYVPDEQVCASTPSADLKPYDSEYTGYMGNYGNTMDRWYRRAAVVVWPRQHAFAARAEASPSWALTELSAQLNAGDLVNARAAAESVAPFWKAPGPELLEPALHTAAGLADPGIALMLLRPFAVEWVTPAHAGGLAALAARYGESWHRNLLDAWFGPRNTWRYTGDVDRKGWAGALPGLTAALRDAGAAATDPLAAAATDPLLAADFEGLPEKVAAIFSRRAPLVDHPVDRLLVAGDDARRKNDRVAFGQAAPGQSGRCRPHRPGEPRPRRHRAVGGVDEGGPVACLVRDFQDALGQRAIWRAIAHHELVCRRAFPGTDAFHQNLPAWLVQRAGPDVKPGPARPLPLARRFPPPLGNQQAAGFRTRRRRVIATVERYGHGGRRHMRRTVYSGVHIARLRSRVRVHMCTRRSAGRVVAGGP